jgi:hypothetical protein
VYVHHPGTTGIVLEINYLKGKSQEDFEVSLDRAGYNKRLKNCKKFSFNFED